VAIGLPEQFMARALEILRELDIETHLVLSATAKITILQETPFRLVT
jgi:3-polyprenyl-4-hydroxybenzoate decarboxylase